MILVIDNYDSFTYNIVQYLKDLGKTVKVWHNNKCSISDIENLAPETIVLSPGPSHPDNSGICLDLVKHFEGKLPIFGVCLGFQIICQFYGGKIIRAKEVVHGKTSTIINNNQGIFKGLKNEFKATRYHSLILDNQTLPNSLEVTAWTKGNEDSSTKYIIMGVQHKVHKIQGVLFHPESILSEFGHELLANFLKDCNS